MFQRIRIVNFRCFTDFTLDLVNLNSSIILGRNGAGKTTIGTVIEILQRMAYQTSRVGELVRPSDLSDKSKNVLSFEVDALIDQQNFKYSISFDFPEKFHELRVSQESLSVDSRVVFSRKVAEVTLHKQQAANASIFGVDWHVTALPVIQAGLSEPISIFRNWLSSVVVLRPVPSLMKGESDKKTKTPKTSAENFGEWYSNISAVDPRYYTPFSEFLTEVMPDLSSVKNLALAMETQQITAEFSYDNVSINVPFNNLSDGEKCFFVCALLLAIAKVGSPVTCFWDEPDNYLAPQEVAPTMFALRRAFVGNNQIILASHNSDAIRSFSDENTTILYRKSHLSNPEAKTLAKIKKEIPNSENALEKWLRGDLDFGN
jgi:ABC-type cobalamin/Fe3+-siderophores transport system ATPase subunit